MSIATQVTGSGGECSMPSSMLAAVYRGVNDVRLEEVPVPTIGAGELLVQVHTCGICGTDLKKIATGGDCGDLALRRCVAGEGSSVRQGHAQLHRQPDRRVHHAGIG